VTTVLNIFFILILKAKVIGSADYVDLNEEESNSNVQGLALDTFCEIGTDLLNALDSKTAEQVFLIKYRRNNFKNTHAKVSSCVASPTIWS
jgi:hypothetical protein